MNRPLAALAASLALAAAAPAAAQAVRLTLGAPIAKGSAALPRIAAPATPATARINAALARLDAHWKAFRAECRADGGAQHSEASRTVTVTMAGPGEVSLLVASESYCGGAYPNSDQIALAYDLTDGRPLDWTKRLPPALVGSATTDTTGDGTTIGAIVSPTLHEIYLKAAKARNGRDASWVSDCADVLGADDLAFQLWPDAKAGAVMLQPAFLPHAVQACGDALPISTATLRRLGVDPALLDAIDTAHASRR